MTQQKIQEDDQELQLKLDQLKIRQRETWLDIHTLAQTGNAKGYDIAALHLSSLRKLAERENDMEDFMQKMEDLAEKYARRTAFMRRVNTVVDLKPKTV